MVCGRASHTIPSWYSCTTEEPNRRVYVVADGAVANGAGAGVQRNVLGATRVEGGWGSGGMGMVRMLFHTGRIQKQKEGEIE